MMRSFISLCLLLLAFSPRALADEFPGNSVFHLKGTWLDVEGKEIHLSKLKGNTLVLAMIYTSCQYSCPLIIEEISRIKRKVPESASSRTRYVLVSFDPLRDSPGALKAYAEKRKLDLSSWTFLTAKSDDPVRELSAVLGVNYKKTGSEFAHSNIITILNGKGEIVFSKPSIGQQIEEAAQAIAKASLESQPK